jgi:flagellin
MASVITTNNASVIAQGNLSGAQSALATSVQRLSSGLRINSAKDDAAGLGISQRLQAQITSNNVAARNAGDAISMVQTAEGGMQEVSSMLQRMRELATQGNNASLNDTQRGYISSEVTALGAEINKISTRTTFNGATLLNGSISTAGSASGTFQVGVAQTDTIDISSLMKDVSTTGGLTALGTAITNLATSSTAVNMSALGTAVDTAIDTIAGYRSSLGSMNNRLDHNIANLQSQAEALSASKSRITDTDYAAETATLSKTQVLSQAATAMLSQANQMPSAVLSLLK